MFMPFKLYDKNKQQAESYSKALNKKML